MKMSIRGQFKKIESKHVVCKLNPDFRCPAECSCNQCNIPIIMMLERILDADRIIMERGVE